MSCSLYLQIMPQSVLLNCIHFILGLGPAAVGSAPNAAIFFCTYDRKQINQSIIQLKINQSKQIEIEEINKQKVWS